MVSYPTWQQTALLPKQRQTAPHWSRIRWEGPKHRLHRTVCAPLNTHEELSHPCHKTDALSQDAQANTLQRAPFQLLTDNPHCPVSSLCITSSLTAIPFCRSSQARLQPSQAHWPASWDMKPYSLKDIEASRCNPHPSALGTGTRRDQPQ